MGTPGSEKLGWVPDLPDHRDQIYSAPLQQLRALPSSVDLRPHFSFPPYDQGQIGSCTGNAIAGAIEFDRAARNETPDFTPSRLFIYYNEREMEGTVAMDNGAQIRDGVKSVAKRGVCPEDVWPYDDTPADPATHLFPAGARDAEKPSKAAYAAAADYQAISYWRVTQSLPQMKGCLAEGYPFIFGFAVYTSLWDDQGKPRTHVPLPSADDTQRGGHAVLCVGYDDATQQFIVRNSWGTKVQEDGYFYLPYAYLADRGLASDFWTIRAIEN